MISLFFFNEGSGNSKIYVFISTGNSFSSPIAWRSANNYNPEPVTGKMVSGYFDSDNKSDIVTIYPLSSSEMEMHFFKSTGSGFNAPLVWRYSDTYNANQITGRTVAGDFDNDSLDDIVTFFDEGSGNSAVHFFKSGGNSFLEPITWLHRSNYNPTLVTNRMVAGDFNFDSKLDIATMPAISDAQSEIHIFLNDSLKKFLPPVSWWSNTNTLDGPIGSGNVVVGDFNSQSTPNNPPLFHRPQNDLAVFYQHELPGNSFATRSNVFECTGSSFTSANDALGYPWLLANTSGTQVRALSSTNTYNPARSQQSDAKLAVYPNPAAASSTLEINLIEGERPLDISIFNLSGLLVYNDRPAMSQSKSYSYSLSEILSEAKTGSVYVVRVTSNKGITTSKFIVGN